MKGILTTDELLAQMPGAFDKKEKAQIGDPKSRSQYPTIDDITVHLAINGFPKSHIYTNDLNSNPHLIESLSEDKEVWSRVVADDMGKYLSASEYYSSGNLIAANQTGLHLYYEKEAGWKQELEKFRNQKSFELGTFIHEAILEPTFPANTKQVMVGANSIMVISRTI